MFYITHKEFNKKTISTHLIIISKLPFITFSLYLPKYFSVCSIFCFCVIAINIAINELSHLGKCSRNNIPIYYQKCIHSEED